ncbi:MAG: DUF4105 domain-containing protein [Gemmatimonadota bacterium]
MIRQQRSWLSRAYTGGIVTALLCSGRGDLLAQHPTPVSPEPGSELTIYLMTFGPGEQIWERFGHNAIGVRDAAAGTDSVFDYGRFSFTEKGFLVHFMQGRMFYWMGSADANWYANLYVNWHRSVWIQELNLTPKQRLEVRDFLRWNEQPENIRYRYDYYRDNCSTRVRDVIDRVMGGAFRRQTDTVTTGTTFRFHTQRLTTADVPMYTGLLSAMGHPIDQPITAWEEMFLPLSVRKFVRTVKIPGPNGQEVPLVKSEHTVYENHAIETRDAPPPWTPYYLLVGAAIGGVGLGLARMGTTRPWARLSFMTLGTFWYLVMGLGGLILLCLWALTDHAVTYQNENILQFDLLALPLVVLLPSGIRRGGRRRLLALRLSVVVATISLAGLLIKLLPWFYQVNLQVIALILPVYLGLAAGLFALAGRDVG